MGKFRPNAGLSHVGPLLQKAAGRFLDHPGSRAQRLWREWTQAVGPQLSRHTEPVRLSAGLLTVRVDSSAWMAELDFLKEELVARLTERIPESRIRQIRLKQGTLRLNAAAEAPARQPPPPWPEPLPEESRRAEALTAQVGDPELKAVLTRLYLKHLIRQRTGR